MAECGADTPVAIFAEGKEHCMMVGLTKMSTEDIASVNKGCAPACVPVRHPRSPV